ncbi:MAG: lysophospholipid acyltransferase family protein [Planctomycetota bacterium]
MAGSGDPTTSAPTLAGPSGFQERCLGLFFGIARVAPWALRLTRPIWVGGAWRAAPEVRGAVRDNLRHVLGTDTPTKKLDRVGKQVVGSFYNFVCEVGANHRATLDQLIARIEGIEGADTFLRARESERGAVLVTAHFGNFEVGLAAMREKEDRVHVVFQRDRMSRFEQIRSDLHRQLGIIETPIDDGMASWLALRDALQADGVVMLQGDRVMPGQRGAAVPFFDGEIELPIGPAKLALMTGAPLIPVFAVRLGKGRVRIVLGRPIEVPDADAVEPALREVGRAIERVVGEHPEQWHVLHRAFAAP